VALNLKKVVPVGLVLWDLILEAEYTWLGEVDQQPEDRTNS